jgi:hypothetical protein
MTRKAAATVRRPGVRMAPAISTSTCGHVGAVKPAMNGCIQPSNLSGMVRAEYVSDICPRIDASERLADGESRANPRRNHMRVNSVGSRTGQMRHQLSLRILQRQDAVLVLACFHGGR